MNTQRSAIIVLAVAAVGLLAGCSGSQDASTTSTTATTPASATHTTETRPTTTTPSTTASPTPVDTTAADQATCSAFEDQAIGNRFQEQLVGTVPPTFNFSSFVPIPVTGTGTVVHSAIAALNTAVAKYEAAPQSSDGPFEKPIIDTYSVAVSTCQGLIIPKPAVYSISCTVDHDVAGYVQYSLHTFATYEEAWALSSASCSARHISGSQYTDQQHSAVETAYGSDKVESLDDLYQRCAKIDLYPNFAPDYPSLSEVQEARGVLILCPDHPQAAMIQANIDAVTFSRVIQPVA